MVNNPTAPNKMNTLNPKQAQDISTGEVIQGQMQSGMDNLDLDNNMMEFNMMENNMVDDQATGQYLKTPTASQYTGSKYGFDFMQTANSELQPIQTDELLPIQTDSPPITPGGG